MKRRKPKPKKKPRKAKAFRGVKARSDWERGLMAAPDDKEWPIGEQTCEC